MRLGQIGFSSPEFLSQQLVLRNVHHRADDFRNFTGTVLGRMSNGMEVLYRSVWKNDSKIPQRVCPLLPGSFYFCSLLDLCSILRMNPLQKLLPSGTGFLRVIPINAKNLFRPEQSTGTQVPGPTPCVAEPLRFGKISFASPDGFFRALMLGQIHHGTNYFTQVAACVHNRVTRGPDVPDSPGGVNEIHVEFEILLVANASLELFPDRGACVVRLD